MTDVLCRVCGEAGRDGGGGGVNVCVCVCVCVCGIHVHGRMSQCSAQSRHGLACLVAYDFYCL